MKTNLIIGTGQLGSRHLQGLLKIKEAQVIFVLDPSEESLKIAKDRSIEIAHQTELYFIQSWDNLPIAFDLVIVATGANVRAVVVTKLLDNYKVKNLILEKILFQDLQSYKNIEALLAQTKTPTWVNHPRRMAPYYQKIKEIIAVSNEQVVFQLVGSNWGLACSALHFIDLCAFITDSEVKKMDMDWVDDVVHESKRMNCIEFTGSIKGTMKNKSNFIISSLNGEIGDITIFISTNSHRWIIQEGRAQQIIYLSKQNAFNKEIIHFETEFQSTLTTRIANDIFESGKCDLPTFEEASASHIPFIEASLKKYTQITGIETTICPIT